MLWVTLPDTPITTTVLTRVITAYGSQAPRIWLQDSITPTAGGRNINGMIAMRKLLVSFMSLTFTTLNYNARKRSTIP